MTPTEKLEFMSKWFKYYPGVFAVAIVPGEINVWFYGDDPKESPINAKVSPIEMYIPENPSIRYTIKEFLNRIGKL